MIAMGASAQNTAGNPDWSELKTPAPPAYSADGLIPIDMPSHISVKIGVDPSTIAVGSDGVVRYVVVMKNATGNMNAAFEGIRCVTDEVKTYARVGASGEWSLTSDPQWRPINDNVPSRHSIAIARQGACVARVATSNQEVLKALKQRQRPTGKDIGF
jgi:hypothetical protein